MKNFTTVEADPKGAASFLRAIKANSSQQIEPQYHEGDWFVRGPEEIQERLGRSSLWSNPSPVGIGFDYERLAGVNIGGNHPVIDDIRFNEGIVTSMKTIDTDAITYKFRNGIFNRGRNCIDEFDSFERVKTADGLDIPRNELKGFHLEIAVRTTINDEQRDELLRVQAYGEEKGIKVIIAEVA
jgi:hypothetical protein